jgi:hypothetical protein
MADVKEQKHPAPTGIAFGPRLLAELDGWVTAKNVGVDPGDKWNRSSTVREAVRRLMAADPIDQSGE